jgi:hypothetical protein
MEILRAYGSTDLVLFPLLDPATGEFVDGLSLAAGDFLIKKNGTGIWTAVTNLPVDIGAGFYAWTPAATELQAKVIVLKGKDQTAPEVWAEQSVIIVTGGDPNAMFYVA